MQENEKLLKNLNTAKTTTLIVSLLTIVNTVLIAVKANLTFTFSCYIPQLITMIFSEIAAEENENIYLYIGVAIALVMALVYFFMWLGSRKKNGFLIAALVLFILDSALLLYDAISVLDASYVIDIFFHAWVIIELVLGIRAAKRLKTAAENQDSIPLSDGQGYEYSYSPDAPQYTEAQPYQFDNTNSHPLGTPVEKSRVLLSAEYNGMTVEVRRSRGLTELIVDGLVYARKEGIVEIEYSISAKVNGVVFMTSFTQSSTMYLYADGQQIAKKFRLY